MNIDKLIHELVKLTGNGSFGSLMNIDKLILFSKNMTKPNGFGSLMNIDKLIPLNHKIRISKVLAL